MHFSVTGRHLDITGPMRQYAEEKTTKLVRFYDRIESIEVVVDRESLQHRVDVLVRTDHKQTFVGQVDAGDYYEAIDLVVDKLQRQLKKHKEKHRNRKHPTKPGHLLGEQETESREG